ncbi:MAG: hypothetical protein R3E88_18105 [Myxococcota bacterium]
MEVEHNGSRVEVAPGATATLGELYELCCASDATPRVLQRVCVDGSELDESEWEASRDRASGGVRRIEIETRTLGEAARASLVHARAYCDPVASAALAVAAGLRDGRRAEAMQTYAHLLDALGVLGGTLAAAGQALAVEHAGSGARDPGDALRGCEDELLPHLQSLLAAQEADDELGIADVLEYEVAPLVRAWAARADALADALAAGPRPEGGSR